MNRYCSVKHFFQAWIAGLGFLLFLSSADGIAATKQNLPTIKGKKVAAQVNGEAIFLHELDRALKTSQGATVPGKQPDEKKRMELLQRLINTRLVIQEARKMGLDDLPELKNMIDVYSRSALREQLMARAVKNTKSDKETAEKAYRDKVAEWKISSVLFERERDALDMVQELRGGKTFEETSKEFIETGRAKKAEKVEYTKVKEVSPAIAGVVSKIAPGSVSPVIPLKEGFAVVKLEDVRYPENPEEKELAELESLKSKRLQALKDYNAILIKKYVKIDQKLLDSIDYESKEPSFQKLLKDERPIAHVSGEKPITVGDLSKQLRQQLFHGVDQAIESKKLNAKKASTLDQVLYRRVFRKEALRLGLDKSEDYKYKVREYENSVIFGAFVQKAVVPDVKLKEEELKTYYQEHVREYSLPEMMRISAIVFSKRADAEGAMEKLRKGTDFQWLLANAEGQAGKESEGLLEFSGMLLATNSLPEGVQKVISGSKSGDFRLYASPESHFYVLAIQQVVPSRPKPYEETREEIGRKVFDDKLKKAMDEWTDKLRAVSAIKIYVRG